MLFTAGWRANAKQRGTLSHPIRFLRDAAVQRAGYSGNRDWILYTHTHRKPLSTRNANPIFSRQRRMNPHGDLCQPVTACLRRLIDCDCCTGVNSCCGVEDGGGAACVLFRLPGCFSPFSSRFNEHLPAFCCHRRLQAELSHLRLQGDSQSRERWRRPETSSGWMS